MSIGSLASGGPGNCAPGVLDWNVLWHVQENCVTVEVAMATKQEAAALADELARRLRGTDADV